MYRNNCTGEIENLRGMCSMRWFYGSTSVSLTRSSAETFFVNVRPANSYKRSAEQPNGSATFAHMCTGSRRQPAARALLNTNDLPSFCWHGRSQSSNFLSLTGPNADLTAFNPSSSRNLLKLCKIPLSVRSLVVTFVSMSRICRISHSNSMGSRDMAWSVPFWHLSNVKCRSTTCTKLKCKPGIPYR